MKPIPTLIALIATPIKARSQNWVLDCYPSYTGFSLLEMMMALSLMITLTLSLLPLFNTLLIRQEADFVLNTLKNAIEFSKNEAFHRGTIISLCNSINRESCSATPDWATGFIVFENPDRQAQAKPHQILEVFPGARYGHLYFSAPGNQLHIHPNGTTTNIGTFIYSPKEIGTLKPMGLVINWAARTYILGEP